MRQASRLLSTSVLLLGVAAAAFLLGRNFAPARSGPSAEAAAGPRIYTCSMHPQVRLDRPGKCPICEMPLVLATSTASEASAVPRLQLSPQALAMARVETVPVERAELARELRAVGKIDFDEFSLATITPRFDGYVERLFVNLTGASIQAGDHLAEVYSPELLLAQEELQIALKGDPVSASSQAKLRRLGMTEAQVEHLLKEGQVTELVTLYSPIRGTVIEKLVVDKQAFRAGDVLYRIADLSTVWVYVDIYEYDLPWIRYGQSVSITAEALPGQTFRGMVTFVQPVVNEVTRTIRVPVVIPNAEQKLKPGMYVSVVVHAALGADGHAAATGVEGRFTCPMHPQVLQPEHGPCSRCGMLLERIPGEGPSAAPAEPRYQCPMKCEGERTHETPGTCSVCEMQLLPVPPSGAGALLAVPLSAVLDSGTRKLVYVEREAGLFEPREVVVGPRAGELVPVLQGLSEHERVAVRGGFLIDSQFQITGHPSLLYPGGLHAAMGHRHGEGAAPTPPTEESAAPDPHAGHKR